MERIVVAQLGARRHYAVPRLLQAEGHLAHFYTDICGDKGWPRHLRILPRSTRPRFLRRLLGRATSDIPEPLLTTFPAFGLSCAVRRAGARSHARKEQIEAWSGRKFSQLIVRSGFHDAAGFYGFSGECLEALMEARAAGLWTVVDQTNAPRGLLHRLFDEEQAAFPHWHAPTGDGPDIGLIAARERAEWDAADVVLCGSDFVREGIAREGGPIRRCVVVAYGANAAFQLPPREPHTGLLRVLTVGEVGLRKGSPYVLSAARSLKGRAVFRMIGGVNVLPRAAGELSEVVELIGAVPRAEILAHYRWADVFLLPSICEGSAGVVYEALAGSLPVICTPNTGSVIRHGQEGFVVPIRDADAIVQAVEALACDPQLRLRMGLNAGIRAAEFSLDSYGRRLLAALPGSGPDRSDAETPRKGGIRHDPPASHSRMRIVHVVDTLDPAFGGPSAAVARAASAQAALGHDVSIVSYGSPAVFDRLASSLAMVPSWERVHNHIVAPEGRLERLLCPRLRRTLRVIVGHADLMHLHGVWEPMLLWAAREARRHGVPYCLCSHGMLDPWSLAQARLKKKIALALAFSRLLNGASFLHALNRDEAGFIRLLNLSPPIVIVPNGVFLEEIEPSAAVLGDGSLVPDQKPFVLFMSRLHHKKGLDYLADSFALLASAHPQIQLVVAGPDDGARADFERRISAARLADRVHLVGPVYGPQKFALLRSCACFCLPSRQEGFSIAITEALACGVPVVISEGCHFPEVVEAGAGEIVPLDAAQIAAALSRIVSNAGAA